MAASGENYFVDGYHGGIYGHYPLEWKTRFIVDEMNSHRNWRLGLEIEPETWDSVKSRTPQAYEAFKALMEEGRMEYTNPTYAQPYCYNISGESLIRQFSYGIAKMHEHFPSMTFTTYSSEEPCFTSCLPAILKGFGFKYASLKCPNTCWGGYVKAYGGQLVNWEGPDGTVMLTVPRYECEALEPKSVWQTIAWGNSPAYLEACRRAGIENPVGMCYQDAGWRNGPWLGADCHGGKYVLWSDYIANHTLGKTADTHRFTQDDLCVNLMWGSQVMQRIGRQVRHAENAMVMAEKAGAIAWGLQGGVMPDFGKIDEGWRQLMLAQHHDSWIVPYNGLWHFGTWADAIKLWTGYADAVATGEITRMAKAVNPGNRLMVKVFNTTSLNRDEIVEVMLPAGFLNGNQDVTLTDCKGRRVACHVIENSAENIGKKGNNIKVNDCSKVQRLQFKATVPPLGYASYRIERVSRKEKKDYDDLVMATPRGDGDVALENENILLVIDLCNGGTVKSLKLKRAGGREYAPADTSTFAMCELRGYFYDEGRFRSSAESPAKIVAQESTPLMQSVTIAGEIAGHPFTQTYRLASGSNRVDCSLHIDWQGNPGIGEYREKKWNHDRRGFCDDRYKLCLLLPTSFDGSRLWKDAPFDSYETALTSNVFNRWSEIKNNVILNWIDVTDCDGNAGLGLLSDHTGSYVHDPEYPTALTLQYSGPGLWGPDYRITGPLDVDFALLPHAGAGSGADAMGDECDRFNEPLQAVMCGGSGKAETASLLGVDAEGYKVSAAIVGRDGGDMTLRLFNSHARGGASVNLNLPSARVTETDLMGNRVAAPSAKTVKGGTRFGVEMPRNGFRTYQVSKK